MTFRLDYITNLQDGTADDIDRILKMFLDLEKEIDLVFDSYSIKNQETPLYDWENSIRLWQECKTALEQAQMYSIKLLCLMGEVKDEIASEEQDASCSMLNRLVQYWKDLDKEEGVEK